MTRIDLESRQQSSDGDKALNDLGRVGKGTGRHRSRTTEWRLGAFGPWLVGCIRGVLSWRRLLEFGEERFAGEPARGAGGVFPFAQAAEADTQSLGGLDLCEAPAAAPGTELAAHGAGAHTHNWILPDRVNFHGGIS